MLKHLQIMNTRRDLSIIMISVAVFIMLALSLVSADCHVNQAASINLVLRSQRNATGHRNVTIVLRSRALPGSGSEDLTGVDVTQNVRLCDGVEIIDTSAVITAPPELGRFPGYEVFPGLGYYKFHTKSVTWDEAFLICVSEGSHMMVVNSEAESNVVKQFLNRKTTVEGTTWPDWMWSGYHDRGLEGDYRTVLGGPLNETGYMKWQSGSPDNYPWGVEVDQDCGSIYKDGLLNDSPCLGKLPFVCEQSM